MQTLAQIVDGALREAHTNVKIASLRTAPIEDRGFATVDRYLATELDQLEVEEPTKQASAQAPAAANEAHRYDDVQFALKCAVALEHGANLVQKIAGPLNKSDGGKPRSGSLPAGGPVAIFRQPHENDKVVVPAPQASAHARAAQANKQVRDGFPKNDRDMQINDGPVVPSNYPTSRVPTTGKHTKKAAQAATLRQLQSKIAQHQMLVSLGQIDAANAVLKEAQQLKAAAESAAGGSTPIFDDNYENARVMPDNAGVRNLTKAQARDANQRQAGAFFGEPVKKDNAVAAHMMSTEGLKLSSRARSLLKTAKSKKPKSGDRSGFHETAADATSQIRANAPFQTITSGVGGGLLGGSLGHQLGKGHLGATALGAGLGAAGLGALGYYSAKGEQAMRDRLRGKSAAYQKLALSLAGVGKTLNKGFRTVGDKAIDVAAGEKGLAQYSSLARRQNLGKKIVGAGAGVAGAGYLGGRAVGGNG